MPGPSSTANAPWPRHIGSDALGPERFGPPPLGRHSAGDQRYFRRGRVADPGRIAFNERRAGGRRRGVRGPASRGRRDHPRQNRDRRIRLYRSPAHPQSLELGAHPRRIEQRVGCRRFVGHVSGSGWFANGRFDHSPGRLLRSRRIQADFRPDRPRGRPRLEPPARPARRDGQQRGRSGDFVAGVGRSAARVTGASTECIRA